MPFLLPNQQRQCTEGSQWSPYRVTEVWGAVIFLPLGKLQCSTNTVQYSTPVKHEKTRMWANAQRDGRPAEHRWRSLFNAAKFG